MPKAPKKPAKNEKPAKAAKVQEDPGFESAIKELLAKAKKDGKIDQRDIFAQIPDTPENVEALDNLYGQLAEKNLLIVSATEPNASDFSSEWAEDEEEEIVLDDQTYLDDIADDSVRLYLREIGKIPLLNAEEELTLAQKIVANQPKLSKILGKLEAFKDDEGFVRELTKQEKKEYQELEAEAKRLSRPKDQMAEANMRLVVSIAKRYVGRGLDLLDLIQEGNTGLLRAVEKFDPDKGFKFSTYATWWIRQAITRAIADQARTIRIPVHMVETINKLLRTQRRLTQELNREPTNEEIAKEMEIDVDKVEHIMKIKQDISSLDASVRDDEEDSVLGDFIEDEESVSPEEAATGQLLKEHVKDMLGALTEREQKILKLRFGLEDGKSHTLEEVGQEFSVTRERIRQIEAKALAKLRKHKDARKLHDYIK
jgi:RNA polymerase primary sigma factor